MGTRSLTYVYSGEEPVICLYRQFDGYPSGHGEELADFLNQFEAITNGMQLGDTRKIANGMDCLAAQLVAHFKNEPGQFYLKPIDVESADYWQEYEYHVYQNQIKVFSGPYSEGRVLFDGNWQEFKSFCSAEEVV